MFKFVLPMLVSAVLFVPSIASADCGCGCCAPVCCCAPANPCDSCNACAPKTRLKLVRVQKEVTRCERVCTVDACGCKHVEKVPVTKCVSRLQLVRVPKEPRCARKVPTCGCPTLDCGCGCN